MKEYLEKRREELRKESGFTLMEMLIVVAIIAILIAIAIPVFTSQLEKSREAADAANIRAKYAEIMVSAIDNPAATNITKTVSLQQANQGWETSGLEATLQSLAGNADWVTGKVKAGGSATLSWVSGTETAPGHITITFA